VYKCVFSLRFGCSCSVLAAAATSHGNAPPPLHLPAQHVCLDPTSFFLHEAIMLCMHSMLCAANPVVYLCLARALYGRSQLPSSSQVYGSCV